MHNFKTRLESIIKSKKINSQVRVLNETKSWRSEKGMMMTIATAESADIVEVSVEVIKKNGKSRGCRQQRERSKQQRYINNENEDYDYQNIIHNQLGIRTSKKKY
ncbi:hypothetical protein OXYTRIMIC_557 [Oxytricha trifallax]|uniref:Uncharacterized protein n=1 Tax=Oxytricha trifallax TaxID=1172189 RepID=A0A073HYX8_9SPIT|nr:hypothetical protein OXYTRIMIC_557 [Oxytricha trifallax]